MLQRRASPRARIQRIRVSFVCLIFITVRSDFACTSILCARARGDGTIAGMKIRIILHTAPSCKGWEYTNAKANGAERDIPLCPILCIDGFPKRLGQGYL
jgi:hypothetical protein